MDLTWSIPVNACLCDLTRALKVACSAVSVGMKITRNVYLVQQTDRAGLLVHLT